MENRPEYTHKGWFWFCPIFIQLNGEVAAVEARYSWLEWLFTVAEGFEAARIYLTTMVNPDYEPSFMFKITGELTPESKVRV